MPETNINGALKIAHEIRKFVETTVITISDNKIPLGHKELEFTVSLGATQINNDKDNNIEASIHRADEALYEAKNSGRNKVCSLL